MSNSKATNAPRKFTSKERPIVKKDSFYLPIEKSVHMFILVPFESHAMNGYYHRLAKYLEFETNVLVYRDPEINEYVPLNVDLLEIIWKREISTIVSVFNEFLRRRIVCLVHYFDHVEIVVNPAFMFKGKEVSLYLKNMFRYRPLSKESRLTFKFKYRNLKTKGKFPYCKEKNE